MGKEEFREFIIRKYQKIKLPKKEFKAISRLIKVALTVGKKKT